MLSLRILQVSALGAACLFGIGSAKAAAAPVFIYDGSTGVMHLDSGLNPGENVLSWLIAGPQALEILAFQDGTAAGGSDWAQAYFGGKEQWIAITGNGVNGSWDVARYAPGLNLGDFGLIEYGLRHSDGSGETGFTSVVSPATPDGDLDGDGFVGLNDLDIILGDWNLNVPPGDIRADISGSGGLPDGFIGLDDLDVVLGNWNAGTPPLLTNIVPEMTSISLVGLGALVFTRRQRSTLNSRTDC